MMHVKKLALLDFKGGFRVGRGDESDSTLPVIHSDTFYGAIVYWAFKLYGEQAKTFALNLKTSSMIFKYEDDYVVPKPLIFDTLQVDDPKILKKSSYVLLSKLSLKKPQESVLKTNPTIIVSIPRNALDRNTNKSSLYFIEAVFIKEDFTPCVILEFPDEYYEMLVNCLKILGESGIGGDSTYGYGLFDFELIDPPELFKRSGKYFLTLSLCIPKEEEIEKIEEEIKKEKPNEAYYKIIRKSGFCKDSAKPKVVLNYLAEGSTFSFPISGRGVIKVENYFIQTSPIVIGFGGDER